MYQVGQNGTIFASLITYQILTNFQFFQCQNKEKICN